MGVISRVSLFCLIWFTVGYTQMPLGWEKTSVFYLAALSGLVFIVAALEEK